MQSGKTFADYFGKNEKSKMVVKVTQRGGGAPQQAALRGSEPPVDKGCPL